MLEATEELINRNIKATDKEEYKMFLDTLKEYAPAGVPAPEAPKKVANTKAPKKPTPAPEAPEATTPAPKTEAKEAPAQEAKEAPKKPKASNAKKLTDTIEVGDTVKFRVEDEETEHPVKIIYISRYDIIEISKNEREVFKVRKVDFNNQVFAWKDKIGRAHV